MHFCYLINEPKSDRLLALRLANGNFKVPQPHEKWEAVGETIHENNEIKRDCNLLEWGVAYIALLRKFLCSSS
jgi:hypothetical protein